MLFLLNSCLNFVKNLLFIFYFMILFGDSSQVLATVSALVLANVSPFTSSVQTNTVEGAIANAIDTAVSLTMLV